MTLCMYTIQPELDLIHPTATPQSGSRSSCRTPPPPRSSEPHGRPDNCRQGQPHARSSSETQSARSARSSPGTFVRVTIVVNDNGRPIGESHARAKYLDDDVDEVRELRSEGYTYRQIAEMMEMPIRTIRGYLDGSRRCQSVAGWKTVKRWKEN